MNLQEKALQAHFDKEKEKVGTSTLEQDAKGNLEEVLKTLFPDLEPILKGKKLAISSEKSKSIFSFSLSAMPNHNRIGSY